MVAILIFLLYKVLVVAVELIKDKMVRNPIILSLRHVSQMKIRIATAISDVMQGDITTFRF